jgi:hypothetical protein
MTNGEYVDEVLIAIIVMRGIERVVFALISAMCLFLGWKLVSNIIEHPVRDDLMNDNWRLHWKRTFIHVMRVMPSVVLAITALGLLYFLMRPTKAHISDLAGPAGGSCVQLPKEPSSNNSRSREYVYEDSGILWENKP